MPIPGNCPRRNNEQLHLNPNTVGRALFLALAADLYTSGVIGPSADLDVFVNRISSAADADDGGAHDGR